VHGLLKDFRMSSGLQGSLMVDVAGTWLTSEDRQFLRQPEVGGLIIFARNIESPRQVRELSASIRAIRPDLLLAVDQEGGRVQRLRQGFVRLPAMRHIADKRNAESLAEACGWLMATEVLSVGLDLSFAPVLDLDYQRSAVVGTRAFEGDPEHAALLAGAFIRGMNAAGMAATGKHFPGHGWAEADSHVAIPTDERSLESIRANDLVPFARLSKQLAAVMPAHVIYPKVDSQPAGFSRRWLQEILRGELGFDGVIFSDDLSMAGAHVVGDAASRIEAALTAGCDMGLVCNDRGAAELALSAAQRMKIKPAPRIAKMRGQSWATTEYRQHPRWLAALSSLRAAQLID
jgi:beta-N-acetylhexosaminidase